MYGGRELVTKCLARKVHAEELGVSGRHYGLNTSSAQEVTIVSGQKVCRMRWVKVKC